MQPNHNHRPNLRTGLFAFALTASLCACGGDDQGPSGPPSDNVVDHTFKVSECGGFAKQKADDARGTFSAGSYCAAETMEWSYDANAQVLTVNDKRAALNCCGEHSVKVTLENGVYVIHEVDAPKNGARCRCSCVYDFSVDIKHVVAGPVAIQVERDLTDDTEPKKVLYQGQLDLTKGAGAAVIDTSAAFGCEEPAKSPPAPVFEYKVSECGGFDGKQSTTTLAAEAYCDAERLRWSYDPANKLLSLQDRRVLLNCCGDNTVKVTRDADGTYVVTELNAPQDGTKRCKCMCVFDVAAAIKDVQSGTITLRIQRDITDDKEPQKTIFEGQLDLTKTAGNHTIDSTNVAPWCQEPTTPPPAVPFTFVASACGGFPTQPPAYCDAEAIYWNYDAAKQTLSLDDKRILLNCCGDHTVTVTQDAAGTYEITELDAPQDGNKRCKCMCVFDFATTLEKLPAAKIKLRVLRDVTDDNLPKKTVFEGTIDLTQGTSGFMVVDKSDVGMWCTGATK